MKTRNIGWTGCILLGLLLCPSAFAQQGMTITQEGGTAIEIGQDSLIEMETAENAEVYILTPAEPSGLAHVTIRESEEQTSQPTVTEASGKRITIWVPPTPEGKEPRIDFLIEGEARLIQGEDRMFAPKSIQFKDLKLDLQGTENQDAELFYTFQTGRKVDWKGEEFTARFAIGPEGDYVLQGFSAGKRNTHFRFFDPRLKGGMAHFVPSSSAPEKETASPGRRVSPSN